ncbi:hypothetical protein BC832DRAFT_362052 [Gaertneriomyces semiglobifer]|nr:hypothetical protein BC832DRAFT_362052 [Gaertneriomyces semiglobifer]
MIHIIHTTHYIASHPAGTAYNHDCTFRLEGQVQVSTIIYSEITMNAPPAVLHSCLLSLPAFAPAFTASFVPSFTPAFMPVFVRRIPSVVPPAFTLTDRRGRSLLPYFPLWMIWVGRFDDLPLARSFTAVGVFIIVAAPTFACRDPSPTSLLACRDKRSCNKLASLRCKFCE